MTLVASIAWTATTPPTAATVIGAHIFGIYLQFIICILGIFNTFGFYLYAIFENRILFFFFVTLKNIIPHQSMECILPYHPLLSHAFPGHFHHKPSISLMRFFTPLL
jgi:hypothetical protein